MKKFLSALLCLMLLLSCAFAEETEELADFSEKFAEYFLAEGENTYASDEYYQSQNLYIGFTSFRQDNSDVYVADIYIRSLECLQRAFGGGKWKAKQQKVRAIAESAGAVLALTGDNSQNFTSGWVVANGEILRKTKNTKRDLCLIYKTGEMVTIEASKINHNEITQNMDSIWQSFLFGPVLLDSEGKAKTKFNTNVGPANPRSIIGYYEPGHYCFVQVDGRKTSSKLEKGKNNSGMTMKQTSALMEQLGCKAAYNLDGGQSSVLWYNGSDISNPYNGGRNVMDAIVLLDLDAE